MAGLRIVVASYLGERRSGVSGYELLSTQISLLGGLEAPIVDGIIIVISGPYQENLLAPILVAAGRHPQIKVLFRMNAGFSYGGWNYAIQQSLLVDDYDGDYFLIEDDYCIVSPAFVEPFYKGKRHAYVCQLIFDDPVRHAAVSNGLLHGAVARNVLATTGSLFLLDSCGLDNYTDGEHIQRTYLKQIELYCAQAGIFFMSDVSAYSRIVFYDQPNHTTKFYGHADMPAMILPYEYWKVRYENNTPLS